MDHSLSSNFVFGVLLVVEVAMIPYSILEDAYYRANTRTNNYCKS
jgi:hypothetical protein